jgi:hypothetical protein
MERVAFLIDESNVRLPCLLNPESFTIQRAVGVSRFSVGQLHGDDLADDPILYSGRGSTSFTLDLLFDVALAGSSIQSADVRDLTAPLWQLAEYHSTNRQIDTPPQVRFIWGKAWNIPCVVAAISERYERFTNSGVPQRSWLRMSLLRVGERIQPATTTPAALADIPERLDATSAGVAGEEPGWETHTLLGGGAGGERLDQLASHYYGDPALWRLLARANNVDDPAQLPTGTLLQVPPRSVVKNTQSSP